MTEDQIIREIKRRCKSFGVRYVSERRSKIELSPGIYCSGYFDADCEEGPTLKIARGLETSHFLGTLLHEYSHVTQWAENCTVWQEDVRWSSICDTDSWLGTRRACSKRMRNTFAARRELEGDNERRTVRLIKELDAPIDLPGYIQRANSYVHFYNVMPVTNQWYHPERVPYKMPHVTSLFRSDQIDDDFTTTPAKQFEALAACSDNLRR